MRKLLLILLLLPVFASAQNITTVPGTGGGIIYNPGQVTIDRYGNLYCGASLGNQVIKINTFGIVSVFAGTSISGYSGDGGPATAAELNRPYALTTDTFGNVYIGDKFNSRIRKVDIATGIITTIAGTGTPGFSGDNGPASAAMLNCPSGLYFDKRGNLYVADYCNDRIRKINAAGIITTIAGDGTNASTGDGGPATAAQCLPNNNMCADTLGSLYFCDNANSTIRKIDTSGTISTVAGVSTGVTAYSGDGVPALGAPIGPNGIAFNEDGELAISDYQNGRIRLIDNTGIIHTVAGNGLFGSTGDGGPAISAEITTSGVTFDRCGNLYFGQTGSLARIRKVLFSPGCSPAGIGYIPIPASFTMRPNPATTSLSITAADRITTIVITNLLGQTIYTHLCNSQQAQLNITDLPAGIYFVKVNRVEVRKLIKQ